MNTARNVGLRWVKEKNSMEILVHGNPEKLKEVRRFTCSACGCMFKADKTEYKSSQQYNETYYYCQCPECGNTAYENK